MGQIVKDQHADGQRLFLISPALDRLAVGLTAESELVQGKRPRVWDNHNRWIAVVADNALG